MIYDKGVRRISGALDLLYIEEEQIKEYISICDELGLSALVETLTMNAK